jgi:hypothetical protein
LTELGFQFVGVDRDSIKAFDFGGNFDAAIIATPPASHYELAMRCMRARKDVLVEKPMGTSHGQATVMADYATKHGLVLSVDSTFCHTKSFAFLKALDKPLLSYQSIRLAPPMPQAQIAAGWDLIVHDLAILQGLGCLTGGGMGIEDGEVAQCAFELPSGGSAFIFASRAWPTKERSIVLHFPGETYKWTLSGLERVGGMVPAPALKEDEEPLKRLILDFELRCAERHLGGITDGTHGAEVVGCLERLFPKHSSSRLGQSRLGNGLHRDKAVQSLSV